MSKTKKMPDHSDDKGAMDRIVNSIKVDSIDRFRYQKGDSSSPIVKFWKFICEHLDLRLKNINVAGAIINHDFSEKLERYMEEYFKKQGGNSYQSRLNAEFTLLDIGPGVFVNSRYGPKETDKTTVYIAKDIERDSGSDGDNNKN